MNIFISGLSTEIKNHVILNQPKSFAEADNLARLRDAVSKSSREATPSNAVANSVQEQRIKELESQVNLLVSLAAVKTNQNFVDPPPMQSLATNQPGPKPSINPFHSTTETRPPRCGESF